MSLRRPAVDPLPTPLRQQVFRGSDAVRAGLSTPDQLRGRAYVRLFRDVYADGRLEIDHRLLVDAVGLLLPARTAIGGRSAVAAAGIADVIDDDTPVEVIAEPGVVLEADGTQAVVALDRERTAAGSRTRL